MMMTIFFSFNFAHAFDDIYTIELPQLFALALFEVHSLSRLISVGIFTTPGPAFVGVFAVLAPAAGGHIVKSKTNYKNNN